MFFSFRGIQESNNANKLNQLISDLQFSSCGMMNKSEAS